MRITDRSQALDLTNPVQAAAPPPEAPTPLVSLPPTRPTISLVDRCKAVGLIVLTGAVGVGVVVSGRTLWLTKTDEMLMPLAETPSDRTPSNSLRDRLPVITPGSNPVKSPESFLSEKPELDYPKRSQRSLSASPPRISHGFGAPESTSTPEFSKSPAAELSTSDEPKVADSSADLPLPAKAALATPAVVPPLTTVQAASATQPAPSDKAIQDLMKVLLAASPSASVAITAPDVPPSQQSPSSLLAPEPKEEPVLHHEGGLH